MNEYCRTCQNECPPSFVYIMAGRPDGAIKVGYARDAKKRAAQLRKSMDPGIELHKRFRVRCEMQAMAIEDAAHSALEKYWSGKGEWFLCPSEVAELEITKCIEACNE